MQGVSGCVSLNVESSVQKYYFSQNKLGAAEFLLNSARVMKLKLVLLL